MRTHDYEQSDEFDGAYRLKGANDVAWRILGWQTESVNVWQCNRCQAAGIERDGGGGVTLNHGSRNCEHNNITWNDEPEYERTGRVVACMIGDDAHHVYDADDFEPIPADAYCRDCGQIGCTCNVYA